MTWFAILYTASFILVTLLFLKLYCWLTIAKCDRDDDMTGKTVLITGASAGIGKATAIALARRNARVILACRNLKKAMKVRSEIISLTGDTNLEVKHLELESFESVRRCAEDVLRTEERLDVLINNAGIVESIPQLTKDGNEKGMQVSHLSHFLLTLLLLDLMKKSAPSRIIIVTSILYFLGVLDLHDMKGEQTNFFFRLTANLYTRLKLTNILFTKELAVRLEGTGVTVNAVHPGLVKTQIPIHWPLAFVIRFLQMWLGKTPEEAAETIDHLAVHPEVRTTSGKFFYGCQEGIVLGKANNKEMARKLFEMSEKIVGEKFNS